MDGDGHVISNLTIPPHGASAGRTGFVRKLQGTIVNLGFENVKVNGSGYNYGGDIPKKWGAGNWLAGQSTFQYIVGRNETVFYQATGQLTCQVTINGEECTSCKREFCHHTGIQGVKVICDNLDGVGNYDPCSGSYKDHNSPLTVFTLQDANLRSASVCSPVFPFFSGLWSPADQTPVLG